MLELKRLGVEIEAIHARGAMNAELADSFQKKVLDVDARLRPVETAFSQSLVDGTRILRTVLIVSSIVLFLAIAWVVLLVLRSTLVHSGQRKQIPCGFSSGRRWHAQDVF